MALNAITLAMMVELENTRIKINLVPPGFTKTNLNGYEGTQSLEEGSREIVRVALLGPDGPTGTFTRWENATIPVLVTLSRTAELNSGLLTHYGAENGADKRRV